MSYAEKQARLMIEVGFERGANQTDYDRLCEIIENFSLEEEFIDRIYNQDGLYFLKQKILLKGNKMKLYHLLAYAALFSVTSIGCCNGCGRGYSDGDRTGVVVKFSNKGLTYKSWEGSLNLGGTMSSDHGAIPSTWDFTVKDPTLIPKVHGALDSGKRVKIHYVQWFSSPIDMDSGYEVVSVTVQELRNILNCNRCNEFVSFAEPNQPDGSFRCYGCRANSYRLIK